jgi:1-acyl-sn-glycerol-3-phosphate acyltransferase
MIWLRRCWRLPAMVATLFLGLAILIVLFPRWNSQQKQDMIRRWANWIIHILGVKVVNRVVSQGLSQSAAGASLNQIPGPFLLASNHISWLDIFVIDSVRPVSFVAKSDIKQWPVIGALCARAGTIFVERSLRHAVRDVLHHMRQELENGRCVGVFPEGTTGNMTALLPFHANLLQAAIAQQTTILPVALSYVTAQGELDLNALFVEPIGFFDSVLRISGVATTTVNLTVCEPVLFTAELTRHSAAQLCFERINRALGKHDPLPVKSDGSSVQPH